MSKKVVESVHANTNWVGAVTSVSYDTTYVAEMSDVNAVEKRVNNFAAEIQKDLTSRFSSLELSVNKKMESLSNIPDAASKSVKELLEKERDELGKAVTGYAENAIKRIKEDAEKQKDEIHSSFRAEQNRASLLIDSQIASKKKKIGVTSLIMSAVALLVSILALLVKMF